MSDIPNELKYTNTHEWARLEEDGTITVGISDAAQGLLGDLVFVELPEIGASVTSGEESGVVESVKAASDIYSPITGEIIAINESLNDTPEVINQDPYNDGWIFKVKPDSEEALVELLDAESYAEHVANEH